MATITCKNHTCPYHTKADFCSKTLVNLNPFGCCVHWWDSVNPQPRPGMWDYPFILPKDITPNYEEAEKVEPPQDKKSGENQDSENSTVNSGKSESDVQNDEKTISGDAET